MGARSSNCWHVHFGDRSGSFLFPAIAWLLILLLFFGRELFSGNVLGSIHPDTDLSYFIALRKIGFYSNGAFGFWNPYAMCGVPLIAEIQSGLFYPPNIVFHIFPLEMALNISLFLHLYLLAIFTYFYGRQIQLSRSASMTAAVVFCFCGPVVLRIFAGHHSNLYTITWIPVVLLIIDRIGNSQGRQNYIYLGLVLSLQTLAGHTQYLLYTLFFSWLYLLFLSSPMLRQNQLRSWAHKHLSFLFGLCIAGLITLPQILPVHEMLSLGVRKSLSLEEVAQFSFPTQNLLTFFTPLIFGDGVKVPYWGVYNPWEMCAYCGTLPLVLSAIAVKDFKKAPRGVFFVFLALLAFIIALGEHTPFFNLLYHLLPGFKMFRGHSKAMIFCCFSVAMMAGAGCDVLRRMPLDDKKYHRLFILTTLALALIWALVMMISYSDFMEGPIKSLFSIIRNDPRVYLPVPQSGSIEFVNAAVKQAAASVRLFVSGFILSFWMVCVAVRFCSRRALIATIFVLSVMDLFIFGKTFISSIDVHHWDMEKKALAYLAQDESLYRCAIATSEGPKYGSTSLLHQITGDYPYVLSRYGRLFNLANSGDALPSMKIGGIRRLSPIFSMLNAKYLVIDSGLRRELQGYLKEYDDGIIAIYRNSRALGRVYLPQRIKMVNGEADALRSMLESSATNGEQIVLERDRIRHERLDARSSNEAFDQRDHVEVIEYKPNRIELRTHLASSRWVLLADVYYPGWKADIDGRSDTPIVQANYIFRAIFAPAGDHEIVLRYRPTYFSIALALGLTTLLLCLALLFVGGPKILDKVLRVTALSQLK